MTDVFYFKKFNVKQSSSVFKIGTDSVLLGAYINCETAKYILDIGCGSGVISLILAQKSIANIHALDINIEACNLAKENFKNSKWADRLKVFCKAVQNFDTKIKYDIIVSNPPYFTSGNPSPQKAKAIAKHDLELDLKDLLLGINRFLSEDGKAYIIYPALQEDYFVKECKNLDLFISEKLFIIPKKGKQANRIIFEIVRKPSKFEISHLTIENDFRHDYSQEYRELTKKYYLNF